ncbi:MAG: sensor histidine kinase [Chloroflexota bacterium]|nr:sensor histidine kinase [Chloroflexota bacterium]
MAASPRSADLALAGALAVLGIVEAVAGSHGDAVWLGVASSVLVAAPLVVRRSSPLLALLVLAATFATVLRYGDGGAPPESLTLLVVWVLATYSVAAYGTLAVALAGLALSSTLPLIVAALGEFSEGEAFTPTDLAFVAIPWIAGRAIRAYRAQAWELRETAHQLEVEREQYAAAAVSLERARLARDVHDVVAHTVSSIAVQADAAQASMADDPETTRLRLARIQGAASDALDDLRGLFGALREAGEPDRPSPGLGELPALADEAAEAGLDVDLTVEVADLADGRALCVYRVVQEALTNIRRHASATRVTISVRRVGAEVRVEVTDDGVGLPAEQAGAGHGLLGIRERVGAYGGTLTVAGEPGAGTSLTVSLPDGFA